MNEAITVSLGWTALMKLNKEGGKLSAHLAEALKQFLDTPPGGRPPFEPYDESVTIKMEWKVPEDLLAKLKDTGADPQQIIPEAVAAYIHKYWPPPLPNKPPSNAWRGTYLIGDFSVGIAQCVYEELSIKAKARCVAPGALILEALRQYVKDPTLASKFDWQGAFGEVRNDFIEPMGGCTSIKFTKCPSELEDRSERVRDRMIRAAIRAFVATGG